MNLIHSDNRSVVWLGLATFAWSMLFVWQGLDFTDMGFWLTGYQQFYTNPVPIYTPCWLSCFIGHWLGMALGGGVLAYKLGYVVVTTISAIIAYQLLASQLGRGRLLAAMVMLTVISSRIYSGNWVGYYELTALFYLIGAALLFIGLLGKRKQFLLLAGVVLGANLFIRFPNLLGVTLVFAVWFQAWACRWSFRDVLAGSSWFLGGFLIGIVLVWGLIVLHGHEAFYFQGIQRLYSAAVDANSDHGTSKLFTRFIWDHFLAFVKAFSIVLVWIWMAKWISKQKKILASFGILLGAMILFYVLYILNQWQWCIPGICYIVLLSIILFKIQEDPQLALSAFLAGMLLLLIPLGSGDGLNLSVYGMWLALPLILSWLWRGHTLTISLGLKENHDGLESNANLSISPRGFRIFALMFILALFFQSLTSAWRHTFRDSNNRFAMTHSIAHPLLVGTYTTAERAKVVGELLDAMHRFIKPGDEVLAYNSITTIHFLTNTHPWLKDPWPDLAISEKIASLIRQKEEVGARLPIIVRATGSTWANSWPVEAKPPIWLHLNKLTPQIFADFVQRHGYVVRWSNIFFEILTIAVPDQ